MWDQLNFAIAQAVRRGQTAFRVPVRQTDTDEVPYDPTAYATRVHHLSERYGSVIAIIPEDPDLMRKGKDQHGHVAELRALQARNSAAIAAIAAIPIPVTGTGQTLYEAIEAYAVYAHDHRKGGANEPKDAKKLRDATPDMPLAEFAYDALETIGSYWRGRPETRRPGAEGKPIAVSTVRNRLKTSRRFVRWLNRSSAWEWRASAEWEAALRMDERGIQSEAELLATADGPETWTNEEIAVLFEHASDYERCLLLFGINLGFAQSELISFRMDGIREDSSMPIVRRVRRKTRRLFAASLWPETVASIAWLQRHRNKAVPDNRGWVVLNAKGQRPTSSQIANLWNRLLDRVQRHHPGFRRLPFKALRKTAYQLVLEASGSMEIAGTFEGRGQVSTDQQADRYGRRLFDRVFEALGQVRNRLGDAIIALASEAPERPAARAREHVAA